MKYSKLILIVIVVLVSIMGYSLTSSKGYKKVSTNEAIEIMKKEKNYVIVDVRTTEEYNEGHIKNAISIPNENIGTGEIAELPNKNQLILVYCRSGNRSRQASEKLVKLGYTNVIDFGGINSWTGEIVK